jgi:hypothetical protein
MNRLIKIARDALPCTSVQFREMPYGEAGLRHFLQDVMALANASVEGERFIVVGVGVDAAGKRSVSHIEESDFSGKPSYRAVITDYVEPPIRLRYKAINLDGKRAGIFEIGDCRDRPYMMKADYSEQLRRGDAYLRSGNKAMKMGRRQLQALFEHKFQESVASSRVEIGFPGEIIHKDLLVPTADLSKMPSIVASANLQQLISTREKFKDAAANTGILRLTHARLYGSDSPFEDKSPTILFEEMSKLKDKFRYDDQYFLFDRNVQKIQLVVYNQGDEPIRDASLVLVMPNHNSVFVASKLPRQMRDGELVDAGSNDLIDYPAVNLKDDAVQVSTNLGELPVNSMTEVFETPLRICIGSDLKGRRLGIRYSLYGSNLRAPAQGKLRLIFQ